MLISDSHQFVFVHVAKTGGDSIKLALWPLSIGPNLSHRSSILRYAGLPRDYRRFRFRVHDTVQRLERQVPAEIYQRYFKFAFVRNPWDRLVSAYSDRLNRPRRRPGRLFQTTNTFDEYVHFEARRGKLFQHKQLAGADGQITLDFIGRFETLQEDFATVCTRLGIGIALPHVNRTHHRPYHQYYDVALRDFVARHWQRDIEAFGYEY